MSGWQWHRTVTILGPTLNVATGQNNIPSADITNYVLFFSGTYPWLATVANGGQVQTVNGIDIAFTADAAGAQLLNFERVGYNPANGQVEFHVQVPKAAFAQNTVLYIQYGQPSGAADVSNRNATWEAAYVGVWHFGNGSILDLTDSTKNHNDGTNHGGVASAGVYGMGSVLLSQASSQYISVASAASLDNISDANPGFVLQWFSKRNSTPPLGTDPAIIGKLGGGGGYGAYARSSAGPGGNSHTQAQVLPNTPQLQDFDVGFASNGDLVASWFRYAPLLAEIQGFSAGNSGGAGLSWTGLGVSSGGGSSVLATSGGIPLYFGYNASASNSFHNANLWAFWDGLIDEVRIRTTLFPDEVAGAGSASGGSNRVIAEWNNFLYPSTFYAIGAAAAGNFTPGGGTSTGTGGGRGDGTAGGGVQPFCATPTPRVPIQSPMFRLRNGVQDVGKGNIDSRTAGNDDPALMHIPDSGQMTREWVIFFERLAKAVCASPANVNPNPGQPTGGVKAGAPQLSPMGVVGTAGHAAGLVVPAGAGFVWP